MTIGNIQVPMKEVNTMAQRKKYICDDNRTEQNQDQSKTEQNRVCDVQRTWRDSVEILQNVI